MDLQLLTLASSILGREDELSEVPWQLEALWTGGEPLSLEVCMEESEQQGLYTGFALLALQAYLPSLRLPPCNIETEPSKCKEVHGWNAVVLYAALYISALGEGCILACLPSLGADQFDHEDPTESCQLPSFFNWFTFGIFFGGLLGLILIVWIQNYKGWGIGFGLCSILILIGLLVVAAGLPFYRNQVPEGSPLTRILQVLVVAFRNRKLELPEKLEEAQESSAGPGTIEGLREKDNLKFLDKACINRGHHGAWSHCSVAKVDETKIVLRLLPLFLSSMVGYVSNPLLLTFTLQQGDMTNTRMGKIHVSPATLFIIPITFQTVMLALYDRFIVPFLRRRTSYASGITHLQLISIGFMSMILASVIAALVERKRKETASQIVGSDPGTTGYPIIFSCKKRAWGNNPRPSTYQPRAIPPEGV